MYEQEKQLVAEAALTYVKDGMIVGLGTGSTTERFIEALGPLVQAGLEIQGVATSLATVRLAEQLHIPLIDLEEGMEIDVTIDGIDQIDGHFQTIKGGGGALFREKIVALMSRELLYLTDSSKFVHHLSGPLPVELDPFALPYVRQRLRDKHVSATLRVKDDRPFVTDGGHVILDVDVSAISDVRVFAKEVKSWSGVLETGYFERQPDHVLTVEEGKVKRIAHPRLRDGGGLV